MFQLSVFAVFLSLSYQVSASILYKCENKDFRIVVTGSDLPSDWLFEEHDHRSFILRLFDHDIKVEVKEGENIYSYDIVAAAADGFGQDSFQAFEKGSPLSPLDQVADFYYEHEGGCLDGGVYSHEQKKWISFDACWGSSNNRMMCETEW